LRGRVAIANAHRAYSLYRARFDGEDWEALAAAGARAQRPLWASTGTKDPAYSDVLYVEQLAGPGVVNTMPQATLLAFADHGRVGRPLVAGLWAAEDTLARAAAAGVDLDAITAALERDGVAAFAAAYGEITADLQERARDTFPATGTSAGA
jgi:transaldolase